MIDERILKPEEQKDLGLDLEECCEIIHDRKNSQPENDHIIELDFDSLDN